MASLRKHKNKDQSFKGFQASVGFDGNRKLFWLGKCSKADATYIVAKLTSLERTKKLGTPPIAADLEWFYSLPEKFKTKLIKAGLIEVDNRLTVGQHFEKLLARSQVKESSIRGLRSDYRAFTDLLGDELLAELTEDHLFAFIASMGELAEATKHRRFHRIRAGLLQSKEIEADLFKAVKVRRPTVDFSKREYIERSEIIEVCGRLDAQFGLAVAMAGLLGMRTPSEQESLDWANVDWGRKLLRIPANKTKARLSPIYGDAMPFFVRYWEEQGRPSSGEMFPSSVNRNTCRHRVLKGFGRDIEAPFRRLRSSCESYLVNDAGFALTDVSRFLGHSPMTAALAYNQLTPETLERAVSLGA